MDWPIALTLMLGLLVCGMLVGLPVAFAFFLVNIVGAILFLGGEPGLMQLVRNAQKSVAQFSLAPIPLFVFMGEILLQTQLANRAIDAIDRLITRVPGRLSLVAITGGVVFASLSGSTIANTAVLGSNLMPEMIRRGYHPNISIGPIVATGGIAMLIPPSALAVLLGSLAKISIADLLIAGILPGLIMAGVFFAYVVASCVARPSLAPSYHVEDRSLAERIIPFVKYVLPLLSLFVIVIGSIVGGVATPTESAALGAIGAILAAFAYRTLTWRNFAKSVQETVIITVMVLFIIAASITFSQILAFSGAMQGLSSLVINADFDRWTILVGMLLVLLFLGCFMDQVSMMMITLPLFMPVVTQAGFDLVWFGILMLIVLEVSLATPPFGLLLFVMKGVVPENITIRQIYVSTLPFVGLELIVLALLLAWPALATWLPSLAR